MYVYVHRLQSGAEQTYGKAYSSKCQGVFNCPIGSQHEYFGINLCIIPFLLQGATVLVGVAKGRAGLLCVLLPAVEAWLSCPWTLRLVGRQDCSVGDAQRHFETEENAIQREDFSQDEMHAARPVTRRALDLPEVTSSVGQPM